MFSQKENRYYEETANVDRFGGGSCWRGNYRRILEAVLFGPCLRDVKSVTENQRAKWKKEISEAINFLHQNNVVWENAKPVT